MNPIAAAWVGLALAIAGTGVWVNRAQAKADRQPKLHAPRSLSEGESADASGTGAPMTLFPAGTVESVFGGPVMSAQSLASAPLTSFDSSAVQSSLASSGSGRATRDFSVAPIPGTTERSFPVVNPAYGRAETPGAISFSPVQRKAV